MFLLLSGVRSCCSVLFAVTAQVTFDDLKLVDLMQQAAGIPQLATPGEVLTQAKRLVASERIKQSHKMQVCGRLAMRFTGDKPRQISNGHSNN